VCYHKRDHNILVQPFTVIAPSCLYNNSEMNLISFWLPLLSSKLDSYKST